MRTKTKIDVASFSIENLIMTLRGQKTILDHDLARLYGVSTKRLNEKVRRNRARFPSDFCFQLTLEELDSIRSQNATASKRNIRYLPYAFTEHGALMSASVLNTPRAVEVSVYVVRVFVKLRDAVLLHKELAGRLVEIEQKVGEHDSAIRALIKAINSLITPEEPQKRRIGFTVDEPKSPYKSKRRYG